MERSTPSHSARTSARPSSCAPARAMTTRSTPCGSKSGQVRKHSRQSRFTRLRRTAPPIFRVTTTPRRDAPKRPPGGPGCGATRSVKWAVPTRRPNRCARTNSACFRSLRSRPKANVTSTSCRASVPGAGAPCGAGWRALCGRRGWTFARGSRGCERDGRCGADRCASWGAGSGARKKAPGPVLVKLGFCRAGDAFRVLSSPGATNFRWSTHA
jgi:hypothetical protein